MLRARLAPVEGGVQAHWTATIEVDGDDTPARVAQMLARYFPAGSAPT